MKDSASELSKSETGFFGSESKIRKGYLKQFNKMRFGGTAPMRSLAPDSECSTFLDAMPHNQGKMIDAVLGDGDDNLAGLAPRKFEKPDVRYLCRDEMMFAAIGPELLKLDNLSKRLRQEWTGG